MPAWILKGESVRRFESVGRAHAAAWAYRSGRGRQHGGTTRSKTHLASFPTPPIRRRCLTHRPEKRHPPHHRHLASRWASEGAGKYLSHENPDRAHWAPVW
eukprot:7234178-Pyramimonas_sp.AAC.1